MLALIFPSKISQTILDEVYPEIRTDLFMSLKKVIGIIKEVYCRFKDDDVPALGAQLVYFLILAFFPFILLLVTLAGLTPLAENQSIAAISRFLPENVFQTAVKILREARIINKATVISTGTLVTLWAASGGTSAAITAINKAYDQEENRPFWKVQIMSVLFTASLALLLLFSFILLVFGEIAGESFFMEIGFSSFFRPLWSVIRFVFPGIITFCVFTALYFYLPNRRLKFSDTVPGAVFSTAGWVLVSMVFSFYVRHFGNVSSIYGSIGSVILLLIWLYWSSIILLLGGELNAALAFAKEGIKKPRGKRYC